MSRRQEFRDLEPFDRRVATMRAAGATISAIAQVMESNLGMVQNALLKPEVARFAMMLTGMVSDDLAPAVEDLNQAIKNKASRAFEIECKNMEDLEQLGDSLDDPKHAIRAKLGAVFTARDILDRAGHRAPKELKITERYAQPVPPQALENLTEVLKEMTSMVKEDHDRNAPDRAILVVDSAPERS